MLISPLHQESALSQPPEMKVRGFKIRCGNICQEVCTTAYRQNHSLNSLLGAWRKPLAGPARYVDRNANLVRVSGIVVVLGLLDFEAEYENDEHDVQAYQERSSQLAVFQLRTHLRTAAGHGLQFHLLTDEFYALHHVFQL